MKNGEANQFMLRALALAQLASTLGEVPVGCVIVQSGKVIGEGFNKREYSSSPIAHAEIIAIQQACQTIGNWRLNNCTVYSTLEPCIMCAGALVHARIGQLYFGAHDPKFGGIESVYKIAQNSQLNHQFSVSSGLLAEECATLLTGFFKSIRARNMR